MADSPLSEIATDCNSAALIVGLSATLLKAPREEMETAIAIAKQLRAHASTLRGYAEREAKLAEVLAGFDGDEAGFMRLVGGQWQALRLGDHQLHYFERIADALATLRSLTPSPEADTE